ncbi:hypothetical protein OH77DRAFT_1587810 [Trametes cingulata]|nr:hypothetical protein OH77DRAFT_1587810 [Trametes cingulata]
MFGLQLQPQTLPTDRSFLGLAEELQVLILLDLDAADIHACTKACRALADVVNRTPAVKYKLELGLAGMIDGPPGETPVGKRLEQLRAYQDTWRKNDIPVQLAFVPRDGGRCYIELLRPASIFSGITEEAKNINHFDELPEADPHSYWCAVDHAQDLVIVTQLELGEIPQMFILSLSQGGAFHPLAAQPHIQGQTELGISLDPTERVEIYGDLVAWTIATDSTDVTVLNWKTGHIVWATGEWHDDNPFFYMRCHILDSTHVLVVENGNLHIHEVDSTKPMVQDSAYTASVCTLKLPAPSGNKTTHGVESHMKRPPTYPGCKPLFQRDPALTLLALKYSICNAPMGHSRAGCKSFLALVPLATVSTQLQRMYSSTEYALADAGSNGTRAETVVQWEDWSVLGARIIELKHPHGFDIAAMGSQCMLTAREQYGQKPEKEIYLIDAHPLANHAPHAELNIEQFPLGISECITEPGSFANPVRSTLPCRIARKEYVSKSEPGVDRITGPSRISHDALLGFRFQSWMSPRMMLKLQQEAAARRHPQYDGAVFEYGAM